MSIIRINVGGEIFTSTTENFYKISFVKKVLERNSQNDKIDGLPFIDCDPKMFREILNDVRKEKKKYALFNNDDVSCIIINKRTDRDLFETLESSNLCKNVSYVSDRTDSIKREFINYTSKEIIYEHNDCYNFTDDAFIIEVENIPNINERLINYKIICEK